MPATATPSTHPTDWPSAPPSISSPPSTSFLPTRMDCVTEKDILMKLYDATKYGTCTYFLRSILV